MFSSWRHAIMDDEDMASIWLRGHEESNSLSVEDRLRFDLVFSEFVWAYWQLWDRARVGVVGREMESRSVQIVAREVGSSAVTNEWWEKNKDSLGPDFCAAVERLG